MTFLSSQDRCHRIGQTREVHIYRLFQLLTVVSLAAFFLSLPQDRCHRIGQTREVHIYRLISVNTIEENILRKSDQKRQLDWLAIQSGEFNTEFLAKAIAGEWLCVSLIE